MPQDRKRPEAPRRAAAGPGEETGAEAEARVQLQVSTYLAELAERVDPQSFLLFLKVVRGLNAAFTRHNRCVDIQLTPAERALYTPQLQREVVALLEMAGFPADRIVTGVGDPATGDGAARGECCGPDCGGACGTGGTGGSDEGAGGREP